MRALRYHRRPIRYAASRIASGLRAGSGAAYGPLELEEPGPLAPPGPDWVQIRPQLSGICGSDLATMEGRSSRWFEPIVSFPFVPGHEIYALDPSDRRVVIEPALGCVSRGISPTCSWCSAGQVGRCERITFGALRPGLQSGFCADTGGGWATEMVAHKSQIHAIPDDLSDTDAVMVEPAACGVHAALSAGSLDGAVVAVIGSGTLGVLTISALTMWNRPAKIIVGAKYPEQIRAARRAGAHEVVDPQGLLRAVRRTVGCLAVGDGDLERLAGGADVVFDCVGSAGSIDNALRMTRPGGRIVLVGMAGPTSIDLTPLWHREVSLTGAYAYGVEPMLGGRRTFDAAIELAGAGRLGALVSAKYSLDRYAEAIDHAANAGRRGAIKVVFDLTDPKRRPVTAPASSTTQAASPDTPALTKDHTA
jgi:threonine dehydrogenase-like Zn-dependent dehydrogenase